jgi:hypothetical protein
MHEFRVGQRRFGRPFPDERLMAMTPTESEGTVRPPTVLGRAGRKMIYAYDFGDSREHSIVLEKRLPADPNFTYPACTDGKLAWPPEDCGGVSGFYELQEALADPRHPRHEEFVDWIGAFDPQAFSLDKVNRLLSPAPRRGKTRARLVEICGYARLPKRHCDPKPQNLDHHLHCLIIDGDEFGLGKKKQSNRRSLPL